MGTPNCQCFWHKNDAKNNQYFIFLPILGGHSGSQLISKANAPLLLTTSIFMSKTLRSKCPYFSWIQCFVYNRWERWIAQSICTHHSCFNHGSVCDPEKNQVQDMNLKKIKSKIWTWKKQGAKKQDHYYSKIRPGCLFSFWITMTLFFAPCFFQVHILGLIFFELQTLKKY